MKIIKIEAHVVPSDVDRAIEWLRREKKYREGHEPTDYIDTAIDALYEKKVRDKNEAEFDAHWAQW